MAYCQKQPIYCYLVRTILFRIPHTQALHPTRIAKHLFRHMLVKNFNIARRLYSIYHRFRGAHVRFTNNEVYLFTYRC